MRTRHIAGKCKSREKIYTYIPISGEALLCDTYFLPKKKKNVGNYLISATKQFRLCSKKTSRSLSSNKQRPHLKVSK